MRLVSPRKGVNIPRMGVNAVGKVVQNYECRSQSRQTAADVAGGGRLGGAVGEKQSTDLRRFFTESQRRERSGCSLMSSFRVLMVCTGNIYRSPLAAALLRAAVDGGPRLKVTSAGTHALVGVRMAPEAASLAARLGAPNRPEHRARALESSMIHEADLVLAMARDHREWILQEAPSAMKRVFTLREFAQLVAAVPDVSPPRSKSRSVRFLEVDDEFLRARVAQLAGNRGIVHALNDSADADVIDPFGMPIAAHDRCAAQLVPAIDEVGRFLASVEVAA